MLRGEEEVGDEGILQGEEGWGVRTVEDKRVEEGMVEDVVEREAEIAEEDSAFTLAGIFDSGAT
jgi:hypothetical protein